MKSLSVVFLIALSMGFHDPVVSAAQTYKLHRSDSIFNKSEVRIGIRYTSDYYYMGRADSARAPYLSPSVGYYHKSGLSVRGSLSYLTSSGEGRIDLYTLSASYDHYGMKTVFGISISEYFFSDLSYSVQSEMSTYLNVYAGYDFSAFIIYVDASLGFSEGTDTFLGAEINRTFFAFRNRIRITPSVYINAGSQKYYREYYTMRSTQTGSGIRKGKYGQQPVPTQNIQISESDKFQLLDYEADLQITYKIQKVRLYISGTWTFPVNPSTVETDQASYKEDLRNGFFWSSGIQYTLK